RAESPFSSATLPLPHSPLFPYTTLFRSDTGLVADYDGYAAEVQQHHEQALRSFAVQAGVADNELHLLKGYPEQAIPEFIAQQGRSEEHTSELQSRENLV